MLKQRRWMLMVIAVVVLVFGAGTAMAKNKNVRKTKVDLKDAKGQSVGEATIGQGAKGVTVTLNLHGLPPGEHAIHFHQVARCEAPDFKSAGGHFNPSGKHHGLKNPAGPHEGDMQNVTVDAHGKLKTTISDENVVLGDGSMTNSLFANGGTAIVIHANADDMKSDPAGNAGDRIACGVIAAPAK